MTRESTQFKKGHIPANKKEGISVDCKKCLTVFTVQPYRKDTAQFCSRSCKAKFNMAKEKHHMWNGGKPKCLDCGSVLSNYNNKHCEEHGRVVGERNGRWISDRTKIKISDRILNDPLRKQWTKTVKDRDGWKCKIADENCAGRLEAHHILPWSKFAELRYEPNNGIALCHYHHPRKSDEVEKLSPYFQELVLATQE